MKRKIGQLQLAFVFGAAYAVVLYFWGTSSGVQIGQGLPEALIAIGRLCGLTAMILILGQVMMISRVRWLEGKIGFDGVTRYHRANGKTLIYLILAHPILLTTGYALQNHIGPVRQFTTLLGWPNVILALIGWLIIVSLVPVAAIGAIRRRLSYEQWYYTHLFMYAAFLLVFFHQLDVGADFREPLFQAFWRALYIVALGLILVYRFGIPSWRNFRHRFIVERVERITPSAVSIYVAGRNMDAFRYRPGQFNIWYILDNKRWWQRHPFTISIEPNGKHIRLSAKGVGDFTKTLGGVKEGTRVFIDGPYGVFTPDLSENKKVLMVAGGSGITPLRAMLPELLEQGRDVRLVYGNQTVRETMLVSELDGLVGPKFSWYNVLSDDPEAAGEHGYVDWNLIQRLVPDALDRTVYLCGPPVMMDKLIPALEAGGVPKERILYERFSL